MQVRKSPNQRRIASPYVYEDETPSSQDYGEANTTIAADVAATRESHGCCRDNITVSSIAISGGAT